MPRQPCPLDLLPVEILHMIFDYLSTYDILRGFVKTSAYLEGVASNYHAYQLNFRSVIKEEFDLICRRISPPGVVSLILADSADTPGQSDLFLSLLPLERFHSTLRALSLLDISDNSMSKLIKHFNLFDRLLSLTIVNSAPPTPGALIDLLPKLIRCNVPHQWLFESFTRMPELTHLILSNRCTYAQMTKIIEHAPKLTSLNICLEGELGPAVDNVTSNLTHLTLNMSGKGSAMNQFRMVAFLPANSLPCESELAERLSRGSFSA